MNPVQVICLIVAIGFFTWSVVSLVRGILKKRKSKDKDKGDDRKDKENIE